MFANVMTCLEELRKDMTKRINRVVERAQLGHERLGEATRPVDTKHPLVLCRELALATKESEERDSRMTREIERLLNDHDKTYAQTWKNLEKILDAKTDLMVPANLTNS